MKTLCDPKHEFVLGFGLWQHYHCWSNVDNWNSDSESGGTTTPGLYLYYPGVLSGPLHRCGLFQTSQRRIHQVVEGENQKIKCSS